MSASAVNSCVAQLRYWVNLFVELQVNTNTVAVLPLCAGTWVLRSVNKNQYNKFYSVYNLIHNIRSGFSMLCYVRR